MSEMWKCPECNGTGKEVRVIEEEVLFYALGREWWEVKKSELELNCYECHGTGYVKAKEEAE